MSHTFLTVLTASALGVAAGNLLSTWVLARVTKRRMIRLLTEQRAAMRASVQHEQERMKAYMAMDA
jgi:hypothetical protein